MALVPYYEITPCCPDLGATAIFNIPDGVLSSGVYIYEDATLPPIEGITFAAGFCYTILYKGTRDFDYPDAPSATVFTSTPVCSPDVCEPCVVSEPFAYEVFACCDSAVTVTINLDVLTANPTGVYKFQGLTPILIGGVEFIFGQCYEITYVGNTLESSGLLINDFLYNGPSCAITESCPACGIDEQYLKFESCCDDAPLYFQMPIGGFFEGLYNYIGTPVSGLENTCYIITVHDVGIAPIETSYDYSLLPVAPIFTEDVTYNTISLTNLNCAFYKKTCPTCVLICYTLYNCDGEWFNTTVDLSAYVGTSQPIQISNAGGIIPGSWYVFFNTGSCTGAIDDIVVDIFTPAPCVCRCFTIVTDFDINGRYIDCDGNIQKIIPLNTSFCSLVYPIIESATGQYELVEGGACVDGVCPILCYELTECTTDEVITSQSQGLAQYFISGDVIELVGYPGCWQVTSDAAKDCSCAVDLTVTIVHADCPTCLGITAYKLTNCENTSDIKYTYDDLSQYIGQTLRTDCGCYIVELIDFEPTSTSPIVIISSFNSCTECLRQYYELTDCNVPENVVYTYTDLSASLDQIITIKGCDTCWIVNETNTPINPGIVTVTGSYPDCPSCTPPLPCLCNRMTNYDTIQRRYTYTDCNDVENGFILQPGKSSGKICLKKWTLTWPETDNLEVFGDCVLNEDQVTYNCPETRPKRKITPGYSVPTCDIDKYEKITCRSSEILYKEVMRLRYGMSNCCPEDDEKWLIKKELIDLAALVDPNYICTPVQTCGCAPSSCGCGCSSTLKTCNSQ